MTVPLLARPLPLARLVLLLAFSLVAGDALAQSAPRVELASVHREPIYQELNLVGTVNSLEDALLSSSVAGLVAAINVNPGDRVDAGDTLVALDDDLARYELAGAEAAAEEARAALSEAQRLLREAESVGAGRNIAATEVSARRSAVSVANAALSRLNAERSRLEALLERHTLTAPFSGVVSERSVNLGEWVTPGDSVARLVNLDALRADFQVPEAFYTALEENATLTLSAGEQSADARIATLVPVSASGARTFLLRAEVPESLPLYPGNAVDAVVNAATGRDGLTVSRDALSRYSDGRVTVWVAVPDDTGTYQVREQRVEVGINFAERVEITSGLSGNEQVVIRGNEALVEGVNVEAVSEGSE